MCRIVFQMMANGALQIRRVGPPALGDSTMHCDGDGFGGYHQKTVGAPYDIVLIVACEFGDSTMHCDGGEFGGYHQKTVGAPYDIVLIAAWEFGDSTMHCDGGEFGGYHQKTVGSTLRYYFYCGFIASRAAKSSAASCAACFSSSKNC